MMNAYHVKRRQSKDPILVSVPGSKSITNRALLIAALADGRSQLTGVLFSDDSRHFLNALKDLGFDLSVDEKNKEVTIQGLGGRLPKSSATVDVGSAGTAARFLSALLGLSDGCFHMKSSDQMKKRPMEELLKTLQSLGAEITFDEEAGHFPLTIGNPHISRKPEDDSICCSVNVDSSSQFLSALLISSVILKNDLRIDVTGSHGMSYVDMTVSMMRQFGVSVEKEEKNGKLTYRIRKEACYKALDYAIEPDLSAASYFYAMGALTGCQSKVKGVHYGGLQGDIAFLHVLEEMGASLKEEPDGIELTPPDRGLCGGDFDLSSFSDQALTLAALAPFAAGPVTIRGISHIRLQECDRIEAILINLREMGAEVSEKDGVVTIFPSKLHGARIRTFEDHRVAMAFALCGLMIEGIVIEDPACCRKTFENYFELLDEI